MKPGRGKAAVELDKTDTIFTLDELKSLARILLHHNIAYDDPEAKEVVDKIFNILEKNK